MCKSMLDMNYSIGVALKLFRRLVFIIFFLLHFAVIRGWLVRRCSGDIGFLKAGGMKVFSFLIQKLYFKTIIIADC
jgi:hypothetical protein